MNGRAEKSPPQTHRIDSVPEQAVAPRRSLADSKTWLDLLDNIENIRHSTQTIFKVSGKYLIKAAYSIEPIFLYDNIILGMSGAKLAFLFGREFKYVGNQLLSEAVNQESYGLAKLVFGTSIAEFICNELQKKYQKVFDADEYCNLAHLTFNFKLCQLSNDVSQWACKFINGQVCLEEAPVELRMNKFQFWESNPLSMDALSYQSEGDCLYSVGCFLENVLYYTQDRQNLLISSAKNTYQDS